MWLCDLEKAVAEMRPFCSTYVFEKIIPMTGGLAFYTSHWSVVTWSSLTGEILERFEDGTVKVLKKRCWRKNK